MSGSGQLIGEARQPIRALTFAGGGFSTALQLGVTHALLVSRGKAPDVVVGISAGALNAVALAEVLQAGAPEGENTEDDPQTRLNCRVARFRQVFERFQKAPGLLSVLLPDSIQIDTKQPLEALQLPIHAVKEREARDRALHSRSGLMNLYNHILAVDVPIGVIARVVRRALGIRALPEIRPRVLRWLVAIGELLRLVDLAGASLVHLAPLFRVLAPASLVGWWDAAPSGASAGELISRSKALQSVRSKIGWLLAFVVLVGVWLVAAPLALLAAAVLVLPLGARFAHWRLRSRPDEGAASSRPAGVRPLHVVVCSSLSLVLRVSVRWILCAALWLLPFAALEFLSTGRLSARTAWMALAGGILAFVAGGLLLWRIGCAPKEVLLRILRRNTLQASLLDPHPLRTLLVQLFDPEYYGRIDMDEVVAHALRNLGQSPREEEPSKKLESYSAATPPIRVGVAAANVATGDVETLKESESVIDALMAAMAVVPIFPPQRMAADGPLYVDGSNVANEPTWPLMNFLRSRIPRDRAHPAPGDLELEASAVHVYPVSPLPLSRSELGARPGQESIREEKAGKGPSGSSGPYWPLVDVAARAVSLQKFRDATLERDLTQLHTRAMPSRGAVVTDAPPGYVGDSGGPYLRARVFPIEPQKEVQVNRRLLVCRTEGERRSAIAETVADGCRAALEAMIQPAINDVAVGGPHWAYSVSCRQAVKCHLGQGDDRAALPGSLPGGGPGLNEVCRHCAVERDERGAAADAFRNRLVCRAPAQSPPRWPKEGEELDSASVGPPHSSGVFESLEGGDTGSPGSSSSDEQASLESLRTALLKERWPASRDGEGRKNGAQKPAEQTGTPCSTRPMVSLLFSGGVFRGVFQMGVANALSELGLRPDIVAGASVGSITAAMIARLFADSDRSDFSRGREDRIVGLRRVAAAFLAIDRLVLTDRFSEFIRTLTVRAAETRFSLCQADRVMRQYDQAAAGEYGRQARIVMAGLERLLYLSPFELKDLLEAMKLQRPDRVLQMLKDFFQELLERGGIGDQILGAEPLELLIDEYVLRPGNAAPGRGRLGAQFDAFLKDGIYFLATTTNLSRGRLEILGEHQVSDPEGQVALLQGLLASSAFPGVFRPRWSWEAMPQSRSVDLLTDGGVMDNLPLDAVAHFLHLAARAKLIAPRPHSDIETGKTAVPHLLFSASLEVDPRRNLTVEEIDALGQNWIDLFKRTRRLVYNHKLRLYEEAQRAVRRLWNARPEGERVNGEPAILDLELVTVRPRWLVGTFAFHPMLGFRRVHAARSIAHGCASTLLEFARLRDDPTRKVWLEAWLGKDSLERLPKERPGPCRDPFEHPARSEPVEEGHCWYRPGEPCPFSREMPQRQQRGVARGGSGREPEVTVEELNVIYRECGQVSTHRGPDPSSRTP